MSAYYVLDRGAQIGPLPMPEIARLWREDRISKDALYACAGDSQWLPLINSTEMAACHPATPGARLTRGQAASLAALTVAGLGFCVWLGFYRWEHSGDTPRRAAAGAHVDDSTEARAMARILITQQMKVPSSTKFFDLSARHVQGREYLVTGFVESQNSFGAAQRQRFLAALEKTDRESWVLQSLALE